MSYQGNVATDNDYYTSQGQPRPLTPQSGRRTQYPMPSIAPNLYPCNGSMHQAWNNGVHIQNGAETIHMSSIQPSVSVIAQYSSPPRNVVPAHLVQKTTPSNAQQTSGRLHATPQSTKSYSMAATPVSASSADSYGYMLLISLAEEYLEAAHDLAPTVAMMMDDRHVEEYQKLVATALGCLEATFKRARPPPRIEAEVRLRYASLLYEETNNYMEAETALVKGISICEMYHFRDLKYAMQFRQAKLMFENNPKAAMKALDRQISDAQAYKHTSWVYALRFLRASYALDSGTTSDNNIAVQNYRAIAETASQLGDRPVHHAATLLETIVHMKSGTAESLENADRSMAAAWTHQLDVNTQLPELQGLTHILDVACSLRRNNNGDNFMINKMQALQTMLDETLKLGTWKKHDDILAIPIHSSQINPGVVSYDTSMILGIGGNGLDNLMLSFLSQRDVFAMSYLLCGMVLLHRQTAVDGKSLQHFEQGLTQLRGENPRTWEARGCLAKYIAKQKWRGQLKCLLQASIALCKAQVSDWVEVSKFLSKIAMTVKEHELSTDGALGTFIMYLNALYYQGTGQLSSALAIFRDRRFNLTQNKTPSSRSPTYDLALLAALNTLWILQHPSHSDPTQNAALLAMLDPHCRTHPDLDIRTAYFLILSTVSPQPLTMVDTKKYLGNALKCSQKTLNAQTLAITFAVMCGRFFANNVGQQAEGNTKAAMTAARKSGSRLWMSVAEGLMAGFCGGCGKLEEEQRAWAEGVKFKAAAGIEGYVDCEADDADAVDLL